MITVLEAVRLPDSDPVEVHMLLREMITFAEEAYGVDINNPKTGDPVWVVMLVTALCCMGAAGLIWHRRKFFGT